MHALAETSLDTRERIDGTIPDIHTKLVPAVATHENTSGKGQVHSPSNLTAY